MSDTSLARLDLVELRIQQALDQQLGAEDVLSPALDEIEVVRRDMAGAKDILRDLWKRGQELRWEVG